MMDVTRWQDLPRRSAATGHNEQPEFREIDKTPKTRVTTEVATRQTVEETPRRTQRTRRPSEKVREIEEGRGTT